MNNISKKLICRILSFVLSAGIVINTIPQIAASEGDLRRIYVSQSSGGGNGSKEAPFNSLEQALKSAAGVVKSMESGTVEVIVGPGTYRLDKTLELGKDINGTDKVELAIVGQEGSLPKITTSKLLPNDKFVKVSDMDVLSKIPAEAKSSIYQLNLKELGINKFGQTNKGDKFRSFDLFMDSELMIPAKWPNDDRTKPVDNTGKSTAGEMIHSDPAEKQYTFTVDVEKERLEKWKNATDAHVFGNLAWGWTTSWYELSNVLPDKNAITIKGELLFDKVTEGYPWFIENLIEELDAPGEYYLDRKTGILYVYPLGNINNTTIEYSVDNSSNFDNNSAQKIIGIDVGNNLRIENLEISNSVGAGITMNYGQVTIKNCKLINLFSGFTSWAAKNAEISGCEIANTKSYAVVMAGGDRATLTPSDSKVSNNYIHKNQLCSRLGGAVIINGCGITLSNNLICDLPHWAVQYGGNDHIIEKNEVYACILESADAGVFYCGRDLTLYGNVLQNNYVHDIRRFDGETGILVFYQDDMASGITVRNNILQRVTGGILNGGGWNNTLTGNVIIDGFANSALAPLCDARGYGTHGEALRTDFWNSSEGQSVAAIPYESESWLNKYPQVKAHVDAEERHIPFNTTVTNNIISNYMREKSGDIAPQVRDYGNVKDNYYIPERLSYEYDERGIIKFTKESEFERLGCEMPDTSQIGVTGSGNYTIPEDRRLYEEYVVELAGADVSEEKVEYPEKELEIVDLLSNPENLEGAGTVKKSGSNVILEPGATVGYKKEKFDSFVLRGKFKTTEEFTYIPIYFRAVNPVDDCWAGNYSYSLWLKSDYMELQKWNPGNTVFSVVPSTIKTDGSWNTIEIVVNTLNNGGVDIYYNLNGKTIFDTTDYDVNKIIDPGYITFCVGGAAMEFGKYDKTLNSENELYTDKNLGLTGGTQKPADSDVNQENTDEPIKVFIDDKEYKLETPAYIKNGRTYVPLRAIFEKFGAKVEWLEEEREVTAFFDNNRLHLGVNQLYAILNGEIIPTDTPPEIKNDRVMIGIRFVSELLGCKVEWEGKTRTVKIYSDGYESTAEQNTDVESEEETKMSVKYNDKNEVLLLHRDLPKIYYNMDTPIKTGVADGKNLDNLINFNDRKEDYYIRTKLLNINFKLSNQQDRKLNVVFFGGSITQNDGYRNLICDWLVEQYGDRFNFVSEAWGGTGSGIGADRLYYDVGSNDPDLVFVEFSVNDSGQNDTVIAKNIESIIRQIYELNDTTEIVFIYTMAERDIDSAAAGKWHHTARVHDYVAEHYGIPAVFVGRELAESVKEGKAIFSKLDQNESNMNLPYYSDDRVHPNQTGSEKYFETIERFLNDLFINDVAGVSVFDMLQVPYLFKDSAGSRKYYKVDDYIEGVGITETDASNYVHAQEGISTVYSTDTAGDGVTFSFNGTQAGIYVLAGPDAGCVDVYVDGEFIYTISAFHQVFTLGTPVTLAIKTPVLEKGDHTVSFKVSEKLADKSMIEGLSDELTNAKNITFESLFVEGIIK